MNTKTFLSLFAALAASTLAAATPVIRAETVTFSQNSSRLVTIGYTLESADAIVTVDVLTNGVSIGTENFTNIDGDVNKRVTPGERIVVWQPRKSWPGHVFKNNEVSVELKAWDVSVPPDYMVVDLSATNALVCYYANANALPDGGLTNDIYRSTKLVMRRIPASGNIWTMGSPSTETDRVAGREPQHLVTMTNDYYLGVFPVTQAQHLLVVGSNPTPSGVRGSDSDYAPVYGEEYQSLRGGSVSWPTNGHAVGGASHLSKWRNLTNIDFDLPTSAQWEFACRAGTGTAYYYGTDAASMGDYAWYSANAGGKLHRVGEKIPNAWGLYDLYGNAWEWCLDWTGNHNSDPVTEPVGPKTGSSDSYRRIGRGGDYASTVGSCRSAKINPQNVPETTTSGASPHKTGYRLSCPPQLKW